MAARTVLNATYNTSVGVRIDMDEMVDILTPDDVPLQSLIGSTPTSSIKVEWMEEDLLPQSVTASSVSGAGPWDVTVADASEIRPGDLLYKDGAAYTVQYNVTAVNYDTNVITMAGFAGNSTAPAANDVLNIIGQYRDEGSDPEAPRSVERVAKYNYTQFGQEAVQVTRTQRKRAMYGQTDPYDHETMKKFRELNIRFERSLVNGVRTLSLDQKKRFMGGLFYYISTNTASGTAANVKASINSLMRKAYEQGGTPRTLMVSPAVKAAISNNIEATRQVMRPETTGGYVIDRVTTDFGDVNITVNRHFPKTKGILLSTEYLTRRVYDGYAHEMLAKTGDAEKGHIVGEFSLEVKNEKAFGLLTVTDAS